MMTTQIFVLCLAQTFFSVLLGIVIGIRIGKKIVINRVMEKYDKHEFDMRTWPDEFRECKSA